MRFHSLDTDTMQISEIYDENELSKIVFNTVQYYKEQAEFWRQTYAQWRHHGLEKANEELINTIQSLREQLSLSYGEFASKKEKEAYETFEREHIHDRMTSKTHGGLVPYLIPEGTGIGTLLRVKCPICGEEKDITDIGAW